jgi:PAS domain S-box-containing protein
MKQIHIKHSLKGKIFLRLTLLVGLALVATSALSAAISINSVWQDATRQLLTLAETESGELESGIDAHRDLTRLLAVDPLVADFLRGHAPASSVRRHLLLKTESVPSLEQIALLNSEGNIVLATDSQVEGRNLSKADHAVRGRQGTFVGPLNLLQGRRTYMISSPLRGADGAVLGVLLAEYSIEKLYSALSGAEALGRTGEYLLLEPEAHGGFCVNPRLSVFSMQGALATLVEGKGEQNDPKQRQQRTQGGASFLCSLAAAGQQGILVAEDADDRTVLAAHTTMRDVGLGLIVKVEEKEILRPVRLLLAVLIGTTFILILLFTFIAVRLSRDLVDPILHLRNCLKKLNTGHWVHKRTIFTGDELEVLDTEVKRLATRLKEAYSSLEQKVAERTRELAEDHAKDEALLESIGEGFLEIDMNGKVMTSNHAAATMLRWRKKDIIGAHASAVLNLHDKGGKPIAPRDHFVQRAIDEKRPVSTTPTDIFVCERKDGTQLPIAIIATPFLMGMEMRGVVVTFRDVTEEKRIDHMKSEFISLASHQLRTPLTAIGWYVELMHGEQQTLSQEQKDYLSQITDSHARMVDLVNSLLNVSRIELGRLKISPEKTTLSAVVERATKELLPQIEQKRLTLERRFPKTLQASLDIQLVQMVLQNLLSNAVKYTPQRGHIDLSILSDGQELRFEVKDSGMGIPRSQQSRVFEKLFRADNVLKTDTEGTGIGLYIAKYTAEAWGGRLWFESKEGRGTTFFFTTPITMQKMDVPENGATEGIGEDSSSPR